jgi:murein DD-endopeptidase MepM/ murein hydrolase activator NlpD
VQALQADADSLDSQISSATARVKVLRSQADRMHSQITSKSADISQTAGELTREQALLGERVTATYKQGDWYYIDLLLGAQNIGDFIARTELLGRVLRANSDTAKQLDASRQTLEKQRADLDRTLVNVAAKQQEAAAVQKALKTLQDARQGKANAEQDVLDEKSNLLADSQKNAKRLLAIARSEEAESDRIESELARAKRGSGRFHGSMAWPVPGFYRVTSPFGMRMHPVLHVMRMHTGIDIGKNGSTPIAGASIVAAASGTVISAGYRSGYGNTVMIDHGNGVVTLYAHQPSGGIKVSVGQHVSRGQRIGTVGMSGYATGPHLHFEVRINGSPVNPMNYL